MLVPLPETKASDACGLWKISADTAGDNVRVFPGEAGNRGGSSGWGGRARGQVVGVPKGTDIRAES